MVLALGLVIGAGSARFLATPEPSEEQIFAASLARGDLADITAEAARCFSERGYDVSGRLLVGRADDGRAVFVSVGEALHDLRAALVPAEPTVSVDQATLECANALDQSEEGGPVAASAEERSAVEACLVESGQDVELLSLDRGPDGAKFAKVVITAGSAEEAALADPAIEQCLGHRGG